ncbi:hypothetical protein FE331_07520 [Dolosigranulum pigrum]|uniref:hypothetical protein n=1 Tax=Dolosigranulum pigrum TaxID=29394 RepID=UPI001AD8899E|nr:hypothetical protein [Dolosigranulum pigrum]QTJ50480.1 hypothetical protein FE331_07520 [Dolosigranulum pigrum]
MNYDKKIYEQLKVMNKHLKVIGDELQNRNELEYYQQQRSNQSLNMLKQTMSDMGLDVSAFSQDAECEECKI